MAVLVNQALLMALCVLSAWCNEVHTESCNVTGVWVNSLGSVLSLSLEGHHLSGSLHTAVESSPGAAGDDKFGKVVGVVGIGNQPTFTMSVSWKEGAVSTWAGQCFWRSHSPVLRTIWLLRSEVSSEDMNWEATRVGEDIFHPKKTHHKD
ncbi:avidin-like [Discoglossus pictus]